MIGCHDSYQRHFSQRNENAEKHNHHVHHHRHFDHHGFSNSDEILDEFNAIYVEPPPYVHSTRTQSAGRCESLLLFNQTDAKIEIEIGSIEVYILLPQNLLF